MLITTNNEISSSDIVERLFNFNRLNLKQFSDGKSQAFTGLNPFHIQN